MKIRTPPSYILWFVVLIVIGLIIIVPWILVILEIVDFDEIFLWVMGTLIGWSTIIVLALIGAIFVGMMLSHRILSIGAFTPFEEEMLKMREDIRAINEKLDSVIKTENKDTKEEE
jgi:hypothetical protein